MNKEEALKALSEGKKVNAPLGWGAYAWVQLTSDLRLIDERKEIYSMGEIFNDQSEDTLWEIVDENKSHSIKGDSRV